MRKLFAFILAAALLTTPVLAAGDPDSRSADPATCAHHFEVSVVREATCSQKGLLAYTCAKCGLTYTAETMPDGDAHKYELTGCTATCTEDGENIYTCVNCGDSYTEPAPATGHVPSEGADCAEPTVCSVCGQVLAPAVGHDYVYQFDAERAEDGSFLSYGTWKCAKCGGVMAATKGNAAYYYGVDLEQDAAETEQEPAQASDTDSALPAAEAEDPAPEAGESSDTDLLLDEDDQYEEDSPTDGAEAADQEEVSADEESEPAQPRTGLWVLVSAAALIVILVETAVLIRSLKKNKTTL